MSRKSNNSSAERVRQDIDDRGAWIAYEALLGIAQDKAAPAPARATAGVAILRTGGLLDAKKNPRDVDPGELDGPELVAQLRELVRSGEAEIQQIEAGARARRGEEDDAISDTDEMRDVFD